MITEEEKEEIINAVVERTLLKIPDVVGNLITNYAAKIRINKEFYTKHPEFDKHRDLVASVIESVEGEDPTRDFEEIVNSAVPKIKRRIEQMKNLDMKKVEKPKLDIDLDFGGQGEI